MRRYGFVIAALAGALLSCDAVNGLMESRWQVVGANGTKGELHVVMNATDLRIGIPEHVRIERVETRTVKKEDGTTGPETREREVRVVSGRCEDRILCEVVPNPSDPKEIVITPRKFGDTTLRLTVMLDEKDEVSDQLPVRVLP
jgi:hypothetical protein